MPKFNYSTNYSPKNTNANLKTRQSLPITGNIPPVLFKIVLR